MQSKKVAKGEAWHLSGKRAPTAGSAAKKLDILTFFTESQAMTMRILLLR